jgi:multisubunit Na+/H+ antiporter MnhB subunit
MLPIFVAIAVGLVAMAFRFLRSRLPAGRRARVDRVGTVLIAIAVAILAANAVLDVDSRYASALFALIGMSMVWKRTRPIPR